MNNGDYSFDTFKKKQDALDMFKESCLDPTVIEAFVFQGG
mgnify:CR=1 FL=1